MNSRLNIFVKRMLDVLFFGGIVLWALMPVLLRRILVLYTSLAQHGPKPELSAVMEAYVPTLISVITGGALALLILWELRRMMGTVLADQCFVKENVISLRRMSRYGIAIAALFFIRSFFFFTLSGTLVSAVFLIAGLFSQVLSIVFDKAVQYKLENDLTI